MIGIVLKIAGGGMLVCGAYLLGKKYRTHLSRRVAVLDSTRLTLRLMREKILHENELLTDCMVACGQLYDLPEGNLFATFQLTAEQDLETQWCAHVDRYLKTNQMYTKTLAQGLGELGKAFNQIHTDSLIAAMDTTCVFLEEAQGAAEKKCAAEGPMAWKITTALGLLVAVLLF